MDNFFTFLKKSLVGLMFTVFAVTAIYVPHQANEIETAEAVVALEITQLGRLAQDFIALVEYIGINLSTTLSAAYNNITSLATGYLQLKESYLDGIAWAIAKGIISSMVQSLVNWINSGFQGSPAFVQDLTGYLLNAADLVASEYIQNLGAIGSFLCSPFQLNIQIALSFSYQQARVNEPASAGANSPGSCTIGGIINNITGFLDGAQGSFSQGGWNDWFDVSGSPERYTPYGGLLSAQIGARANILGAQFDSKSVADFGSGFLSNAICKTVTGSWGSKKTCNITTPGKAIQEALSFNLDSGRQSLIAADEINEIISALFGQLANAALTGAAGLLGLSGGTGVTYPGFNGGSYLNNVVASSSINTQGALNQIQTALNVQTAFNQNAKAYRPHLSTIVGTVRQQAQAAATEAAQVINNTAASIPILQGFITQLLRSNITTSAQNAIINQFSTMSLYSGGQARATVQNWQSLLNTNSSLSRTPVITVSAPPIP